jgi:MSHA biogenesis protein MshQ
VAIGGSSGELLLSSSSGSWAAGIGTFSVNAMLNRSASLPIGPYESFQLGVAPVDTDGVTVRGGDKNLDISAPADAVNDKVSVGSSRIRLGRLRLQNAFGSEKLPLAVPLQAQYWAGSYFVNNTDDSCTTLSVPPAVTLTGSATPGGSAGLYFYPVLSGKNELPPQTPTLNGSASGVLNAGKINVQFAKPDKRGWLDMVLNVPDYLKYNWGNCNGQSGAAGLLDDLPCARATFGIFGAKSPIIYRRENY